MFARHHLFALLFLAATRAGAQDNTPNSTPPFIQTLPAQPATETPEPEIALDELIRRALANNPQPQIAANDLAAAQERAASARAQLNPTLQIVPGIGGNSASRDEEIILSQPLDVFGQRRASRRVLDAEVRRAHAQKTLTDRSLVVQIKNAVTDLFAAQEAESLGQSQVDIARAFRDAAARKATLGDAPPVQTQRAQLELDRAQVELEQAHAERLSRRATLNQLIGAPPESPLRVALPDAGILAFANLAVGNLPATGIPSHSPAADQAATAQTTSPQTPIVGASSQVGSDLVASRASLLPGALQRPDILAAQAGVEAARAQAEAIGRQRRPLIEVQARRGGVFDSASSSVRAVVTVPLFDFGSIKREQSAARYDALAQENQVSLLRSQAAAQVESALVRLNQSRLTVERYRTSLVPQTLDLLRKTQVGYAAGASTYLEVLEAQRAARQIQTEYLQALVGARTGEAALESALGSSLPPSAALFPSTSTGDLNNSPNPIIPNSTSPTHSAMPGDNLPGGPVR